MEIEQMNIYEKMLHIQNEMATVNKNLTVGDGSGKYKAVSEPDVLNAVKVLEEKYRVFSFPASREVLESQMYTTKNFKGQEKNNIFSRIKTTYRFINVDKPEEYIDTITFAEGIDSQDKGAGKAMTYSDKYALMKAYKIVTGEDPDQNISENVQIKNSNTQVKTPAKINAVQKNVTDEVIDNIHYSAFMAWIEKNNISEIAVITTLQKFGYSDPRKIKIKDYKNIVNMLNSNVQEA